VPSKNSSSAQAADLYDIPVVDTEGRERTRADYRGDVLLIVNTASY
jgi:glutathione peroxidase-family protein